MALATLRILPRSGRIAWVSRVRACLAEPPAEVALDDEDLGARAIADRAVGELAGQAQLAGRRLPLDLPGLLACQALLGAHDEVVEQGHGRGGMLAEPELEMVLDRCLDEPRHLGRDQPLLGLALELRRLVEERDQDRRTAGDVVGCEDRGFLVGDPLGVGAQRLEERCPKTLLVGAAERGRHGVAVEALITFLVDRPGDRPFDPPCPLRQIGLAGEGLRYDRVAAFQQALEKVGEAGREMEDVFGRDGLALDQGRIARPADLHTLEEIGLGARHPMQALGLEGELVAEDLRIGDEADRRAAAVLHHALALRRAQRRALGVGLAEEGLVARHLHLELEC